MVRKPHKGLTVSYVDGRAARITPLTVETSYHATRGAGRGLRIRALTESGSLWDVFASSCFRSRHAANCYIARTECEL